MTINERIFKTIKSAFVPLLKNVISLIPTKTSQLDNNSGFVTESYVDDAVASGSSAHLYISTAINDTNEKQNILDVTGDFVNVFSNIKSGRNDLVYADVDENTSGAKVYLSLAASSISQTSLSIIFTGHVFSGSSMTFFDLNIKSASSAPTDGTYYFTPEQAVTIGLPESYVLFDLSIMTYKYKIVVSDTAPTDADNNTITIVR